MLFCMTLNKRERRNSRDSPHTLWASASDQKGFSFGFFSACAITAECSSGTGATLGNQGLAKKKGQFPTFLSSHRPLFWSSCFKGRAFLRVCHTLCAILHWSEQEHKRRRQETNPHSGSYFTFGSLPQHTVILNLTEPPSESRDVSCVKWGGRL